MFVWAKCAEVAIFATYIANYAKYSKLDSVFKYRVDVGNRSVGFGFLQGSTCIAISTHSSAGSLHLCR